MHTSEEKQLDTLHSAYTAAGFPGREAWQKAPAILDGHTLKILGHPVMEDWEIPYMQKMAEIVTANGGTVLEVGFGMAIAAGFIQQADITKHIIIEANVDIAQRAREFAKQAQHPVEVIEGFWEDVIEQIPDNSIDGLLFDIYPLEEVEVMQQVRFAPIALRKLKPGGTFTYYADEVDRFREEHHSKLVEAGFAPEHVNGVIVNVNPPESCTYWKASTMWAPHLTKA